MDLCDKHEGFVYVSPNCILCAEDKMFAEARSTLARKLIEAARDVDVADRAWPEVRHRMLDAMEQLCKKLGVNVDG